MKKAVFTTLIFGLLLVGCGRKVENTGVSGDNQASSTTVENKVGLANPASANCEAQGGKLEIKEKANGQYGICYFEDNRQCEEWALFRGECPKGGLKITGYENDAQIFCAITGGQVDMQKNICTTVKGGKCDIEAYYNGGCEKNDSTADWKTYKSEQGGFEIKYPSDAKIVTGDYNKNNWDFFINIVGSDGKNSPIDIGVFNGVNDFITFKEGMPVYFNDKSGKLESVRIGKENYKAFKYSIQYFSEDEGDLDNIDYYIEHNNKLFRIRYDKLNKKSLNLNEFQEILNSFKFTN